jgi:A/G-specific adenine glycosylase
VTSGEPRRALLRWYRRHRRRLPWRASRDPYAIWVSEIMLQQTRVETALRYYPRFLERFPTLESLARAPQSAVLARWSGLGYYSRARQLHDAARAVVARHGGRLPRDLAALRALPGIGRYTAGAIASIAFGARAPLVDGNVARVLARHFEIPGSPRSADFQRRVWTLAERLVPARSPGDWNQALMELGATICTALAPACGQCPVRRSCASRRSGRVALFPERARRAAPRSERRACVALERGDRVLLARRASGRLLRGLWQLPSRPVPEGRSADEVAREIVADLGVPAAGLRADRSIRHSIMERRIESVIFCARGRDREPPPGARWFRWRELGAVPVSTVELRLSRERSLPMVATAPSAARKLVPNALSLWGEGWPKARVRGRHLAIQSSR